MQAHVALGVSLLVALSLGAVVVVTSDVITRRAMADAGRDLAAARTAFDRLLENRGREASVQTSLIARLPVFRAHMIDPQLAGDAATMDAMAAEYRAQLGAGFLVVGSRRTAVTGRDGYPGTELTSIVEQARHDAGDGKPSRRVASIGGVLYLVVAEPARFADEVLGSLVVGFVLDDAVTRELAAITRCDVNLVAEGGLVATSLQPPSRRALETLVRTASLSAGGPPSLRRLEDAEYVTAVSPLGHETEPATEGQLVLLQDWQPTRQSLRELRQQLTLGGAVIFVAALAGALVFSGRVTRSLADISRAAADTAAGDWDRRLPEHGSAEVQSLARAVNAMATNLRRHHADIEAQRLRVFRATMTTVHDLVNNFLANMQLIRMEAEDRLPQDTLDLFDRLIDDNAAELRLLGELEVVREKEMAVGTGIEYPSATSRDAA
jgi:HAMP domain-containing protein